MKIRWLFHNLMQDGYGNAYACPDFWQTWLSYPNTEVTGLVEEKPMAAFLAAFADVGIKKLRVFDPINN